MVRVELIIVLTEVPLGSLYSILLIFYIHVLTKGRNFLLIFFHENHYLTGISSLTHTKIDVSSL